MIAKLSALANGRDGNLSGDVRIGDGYVHDGNQNKGTARLLWKLRPAKTGEYEIVFHYIPNENRAKNVSLVLKGIGADRIFLAG
jgi:hypothetical protein